MAHVADAYELSSLGWLLFEELCAVWLERAAGVPVSAWQGSADRERFVVVEEPVLDLEPPVTVATLWVRTPRSVEDRLPPRRASGPSLLVLTNGPGLDTSGSVRVLGAAELGAAIDGDPELRLRLPSVLGVRREPVAGSDEALALAERFVATRAYRRAVAVLQAHNFCVLTGPPEMGKTAAARMIGLALASDGWETHECTRPEQVLERLDHATPQLFIADDAFGSTEYRPDAADRWARALPAILAATDEQHWLIWTSRPTPLKSGLRRFRRERGAERFPLPGEVHVDAADLDVAEKALILFRHALATRPPTLPVKFVRAHGPAIVAHPHFTPERIRRFVHTSTQELADAGPGEMSEAVRREIERPTEAMAASFRALGPAHKAVLVAMLDSPPSIVSERELAHAARRHVPAGLERSPVALVDRLTDHFLRLVPPTSVTWVHPSWRDLVIDELASDPAARRDFLRTCGHHGALLALSTGGGATGERALPLLADDEDWDALADRLPELLHGEEERELTELLGALRAAIEEPRGASDRRGELNSLAELALHVAAHGRSGHRPASLPLLEEWLRLAPHTSDAPPPPWLGDTWIELLPTAAPRVGDRAELARYEDWLTLAELLAELRPQALVRLGFPGDRQLEIAREVARAAELEILERAGSPAAIAPSRRILRLTRLLGADMPGWERAEAVRDTLLPAGRVEADPEFPPAWPDAAEGLVARVLADLH